MLTQITVPLAQAASTQSSEQFKIEKLEADVTELQERLKVRDSIVQSQELIIKAAIVDSQPQASGRGTLQHLTPRQQSDMRKIVTPRQQPASKLPRTPGVASSSGQESKLEGLTPRKRSGIPFSVGVASSHGTPKQFREAAKTTELRQSELENSRLRSHVTQLLKVRLAHTPGGVAASFRGKACSDKVQRIVHQSCMNDCVS